MKLNSQAVQLARKRLLKMHFDSGVGHIGGNLSVLDSLMLLWCEIMSENDSFVLSKGHAAGALYISLWNIGLLSDSDLTEFHKDNTKLPGHPPANLLPGVPFATGSLGHGLSLAAGTAIAKKLKNSIGHVYCVTSDGEWQEGSTWEALIFLSHHSLSNLTILVDHNNLQGFGTTSDVASMSPLGEKLKGFNVDIFYADGHDLDSLRKALAVRSSYPKIIIMHTIKGHGVSFMENKMEWHYLPLTESKYMQAMAEVSAL